MLLHKNSLKLFFRTKSLFIPLIVVFIIENYFLFTLIKSFLNADDYSGTSLYILGDMQYGSYLLFIFFLYIGFEYFKKLKDTDLKEALSVIYHKIELSQFFVTLSILLCLSLVYFSYSIVGFLILNMSNECFGEILRFIIYNVILVSLGALSIGYIMSNYFNRIIGYLSTFILIFLFIPKNDNTLSQTLGPFMYVLDIFRIVPRDLQLFPDPLYGLPLDTYRIATTCFWIFITIFLFIISNKALNKKIKFSILAITTILAFGSFVLTYDKGSVLIKEGHPDSAQQEYFLEDLQNCYNEHKNDLPSDEIINFHVLDYDMKLTFSDRLSAEITMKLNEKELEPLDDFTFTLYRKYKVSDVYDAHKQSIPFTQSGNYLTIKHNKDYNYSKIQVCYSGYSNNFYSNSHACALYGFFPYYPKAGRKNLLMPNTNSSWVYDCCDSYKSHFTVQTNGLEVISNLKGEKNNFEGNSSNITLIGGNCKMEYSNDKQCLCTVFPLLEKSREILKHTEADEQYAKEWQALLTNLGIDDRKDLANAFEKKTRFEINGIFHIQSYYSFDDYCITHADAQLWGPPCDLYKRLNISEKKRILYSNFINPATRETQEGIKDFVNDPDIDSYIKANDGYTQTALVYLLFDKYGTDDSRKKIMNYIIYNDDKREPTEYLKNLLTNGLD